MSPLPKTLDDAIARGAWKDPGPDALASLLDPQLDLSPLELFVTADTMRRVWEQLDAGGLVDDPEFCMARRAAAPDPADPRLVYDDAIFIAGSTTPGDDELVALDLTSGADDPEVRVFDWDRAAPARWVSVGRLSDLLARLRAHHASAGRG